MYHIALIHPSRGRAEQAVQTALRWIQTSSGKHNIVHALVIDNDDPTKDEYEAYWMEKIRTQWTDPYKGNITGKSIFYADHPGDNVVSATNYGAKKIYSTAHFCPDIFIYLSDDFKPCDNWDELIVNKIQSRPKDDKWLLKVNDGVQDPKNTVLTIPIMSIGLYKHLGNFWHNEYKSMWVDVDLYHTCKEYMIEAHDILLQHDHPMWVGSRNKMDETYQRSTKNWNQGAEIFNKRRQQFNWPCEPAKMVAE